MNLNSTRSPQPTEHGSRRESLMNWLPQLQKARPACLFSKSRERSSWNKLQGRSCNPNLTLCFLPAHPWCHSQNLKWYSQTLNLTATSYCPNACQLCQPRLLPTPTSYPLAMPTCAHQLDSPKTGLGGWPRVEHSKYCQMNKWVNEWMVWPYRGQSKDRQLNCL